ncbi:acetyl-CoA carboxylase biotin carboxyl carrier protein [Actinomadura sp. HBU206391]|uniref:acetyl-CoA carboxylase biotin carboxyl carrier protein n=1 Tax=Actinomadura sp. HBU206391 TaxID=2731692 RepID=UPI00164F76CF|nr:biotin/lipoyl-containing protein [Actinomadura sp. HBU206391]MBC6456906.1 acetyl-CoA carboxylase biotin carboxyl carrier protein subunit [Actinomadura sp. HBU206391]
MTGAEHGEPEQPPDPCMESVLDGVWRAALELLESLPDRPERLRVTAADVTVDLDWRSPTASLITSPPAGAGRTAEGPVASPPGRSGDDLPAEERLPVRHYVCAPSIGTFHRAPEPGAPPFVAEGTTISSGDQVAIIEAMKLMLPVEADRSGLVVEVLIEDGQAVEYGERLLALTPVSTE